MTDLLKPHQQRVCIEFTELDSNVRKLSVFKDTVHFSMLSFIEQELLRDQLTHMSAYLNTLRRRLSLWGVDVRENGYGIVLIKDGIDVTAGTPKTIEASDG